MTIALVKRKNVNGMEIVMPVELIMQNPRGNVLASE